MEFKDHTPTFNQPDSHGDIIRPSKKFHTFLWLDDIRNPFIPQYINQYPILKNSYHKMKNGGLNIIWVRDFNEFIQWIDYNNELPDYISFDHDLADEHYTPPKYWDDYQASKNYQQEKEKNYQEKTGLDCAKWIVEYCLYNKTSLPKYFSHSANPVGRDNILNLLNNFKKHNS